MEIGGVGGYVGGLPDLILLIQIAILPEGYIVLLIIFLIKIISSIMDDFTR
jgi:hypothetical protein